MSGIYLHIPFCERSCHYCNFHFTTSLRNKKDLLTAMNEELRLRQDYLVSPPKTIYFGGGTPSILEVEEVEQLLQTIHKYYDTKQVSEITLEANPNDLTIAKLKGYFALGVNRLSIGTQSFFDRDLLALNRSHTAAEATECIYMAKEQGFFNISIDLIYGIPQMSDWQWQQNIDKAISLDICHISCYCLTVEDKTALAEMIKRKKFPDVSEKQGAKQFQILMDAMAKNNYLHYEISNFCRDHLFSQHNTAYWQAVPYLGIGPAAHSFNGQNRQWNIANNKRYIDSIKQKKLPCEQETLTKENQVNEYVMTSLRTMWGCNLSVLENNFGVEIKKTIHQKSQKYIHNQMISEQKNNLVLTQKGKLIADYITMDLFCD